MTKFDKYDWYGKPLDILIGKKVLSIYGDKNSFAIETDQGSYTFDAYGDCCSVSWFENISGIDNLVGHTVLSVRTDDLPSPESSEESYECIQAYGWTVTTDKGYFQIEMRNSSNGYYGGSIEVSEGRDKNLKPLVDF